ncbi:hypoxanthine phosphoribosyltransferase [Endomicrobiia bacterium]|nr:hypoxanthine phosphoribosyltransferase [Endomicrobiia bacterium]
MMNIEGKYVVDVLLSEEEIQKRVSEVALQISKDFKDKEVLLVSVLNGSFVFSADLIRKMDMKCKIDFISLSSYLGTHSQGKVKILSEFKEDIIGKDIIIIEDILDTGTTLDFLKREIAFKKPKSITTCVLLDKKCARKTEVDVEYSCFEIGNDFVVGYGIDYNGFFRGLPYIGILKGSTQ